MRWRRRPPQQKALDLPRLRLGKLVQELDLPWVLVPPHAGFDDVDDLVGQAGVRRLSRLQDDEGRDDLPSELIRPAHHGGFGHRGMAENGAFHLEGPDPVARALDHVVGPALEPEMPVAVSPPEIADGHPVTAIALAFPLLVTPVAE